MPCDELVDASGEQSPLMRIDAWQPAIRSRRLRSKPRQIVLGGERFVAWRDDRGRAVVQADRCPHRNMSLSCGSVRDGCLVCPYHGWKFDSDGCGTSPGTPRMTVQADRMDTMERGGVVWIKPPGASSELPELSYPGYHLLMLAWADFKAPVELLYDNFADVEHTGAAHWQFGYVTDRMDEVRLECTATDEAVTARATGPAKPMPWGGRKLLGVKQGDDLTIAYRASSAPLSIVFDWWWHDPQTGAERRGKFREIAFFVPIAARRCRLVSWYLWTIPPTGSLGLNWVGGAIMRRLIWYEMELDRRIIENIVPGSTQLEGQRLSRFDKPVLQSRYRIEGRSVSEESSVPA